MTMSPELKKQMQEWSQNILLCRTYQHNWNSYTVETIGSNFLVTLVCGRCESMKHQTVDSTTGAVLRTSRTYAHGYLSKGIGRVIGDDRNAVRLEVMMRAVRTQKRPPRHLSPVRNAS